MGLAIEVGMLEQMREDDEEGAEFFEEAFGIVNKYLAAEGLPLHSEPDHVEIDSRAGIGSFPYSYIHYLRRAFVHRRADAKWVARPLGEDEDPSDDALLREEYEGTMASHLVCHSDAEGFYVPVDFPDIIAGADDLPGGILGSSQQLMRDLVLVAPALGIELQNGALSDAEAARVNGAAETDVGLHREHCVWIALYEAARISIAQRTVIVFC